MRFLRGFGQFWYDFLIGDDWKIAVAVATVLVVGALVVVAGGYDDEILTSLLAVGVAAAFSAAVLIDVRGDKK